MPIPSSIQPALEKAGFINKLDIDKSVPGDQFLAGFIHFLVEAGAIEIADKSALGPCIKAWPKNTSACGKKVQQENFPSGGRSSSLDLSSLGF